MKSFFQHIKYLPLIVVYFLAGILLLGSCKEFADVPPPNNQLTTQTLFRSDNTVLSALAGIYTMTYITNGQTFHIDLSVCPENSADETHFYTNNDTYDPFYLNNIEISNSVVLRMWTHLYKTNYIATSIIDGVQANSAYLTDSIQTQAIGEAKFMRAFCYFYLVNLFGDVPLVLTTDAINTTNSPRVPKDLVWDQIIADLLDAQSLLRNDYNASPYNDRVRPNQYAATALLARVYLYLGRWSEAETQATAVIDNSSLYSLQPTANLEDVFLKNNTEAIFQMDGPSNNNIYRGYNNLAWQYIYYNTISRIPWMVLTDELMEAFEEGDSRPAAWVRSIDYNGTTYYYPYKYKNMNPTTGADAEAYVYLRLAEQYLIRAEARAQQGNTTGAASDINAIRGRAGLQNTTAATQADLLLAVEQERRIELFCELGHRWYDLKRTNRAGAVLGAVNPDWTNTAVLYPIPESERLNNPNLTQNDGY